MVVKEKKERSIWENSEQEKLGKSCIKLNSALLGNEMVEEDKTDYISLYHGILSISQIYILGSYCEPKTISCIRQR